MQQYSLLPLDIFFTYALEEGNTITVHLISRSILTIFLKYSKKPNALD